MKEGKVKESIKKLCTCIAAGMSALSTFDEDANNFAKSLYTSLSISVRFNN